MKTVSLGKVAKIDRTVATDDECLTLPYVGLEHVEKESGRFVDGFVPTPLNMLATNFRFTPKHVLYGKLRPYLNKVVLPNFDGVCTTEILPILPNEEKLDRTFLWAILLSPTFVNWATSQISGANLPRLDPKLLAEYEIPLPPLTEQKRIASLLARADRLRGMRQTAHELGESLLQSVFLEMFGDPKFNEKKWQLELGEELFIKIGYGVGTPPPFIDKGNIFLRAMNIKPSGINLNKVVYFSSEYEKEMSRSKVKAGDVVVVRRGANTGDTALIPPELDGAYVGYDLILHPDETKMLGVYFVKLMNTDHFRSHIYQIRERAAQQGLNAEQIGELVIPVPPLSLQEEFAGVVARVESLRGRMSEAERQVEGLFESLLAEAFHG